MAFHDVQLRDDIERGAEGGPGFKTNVLTLSNGKEKRNQEWELARGEWDIGYGIQEKAGYDEVRAFFYSRRGRAHSFRFKDWSDYYMDRQTIGEGTGALTTFSLFKTYSDGTYSYDRPLTKPVVGTVKVWKDAVLQNSGYTVNYLTGVITFTAAPADNVVIEAQCQFDVPVRFDVDKFPLNLTWEEAGTISSLMIVEVDE